MAKKHPEHVERALDALKKPLSETLEGAKPNDDNALKKPKVDWVELAHTGDHHRTQSISHK